jgi:DNA-binding transcriptional regulator YiaG
MGQKKVWKRCPLTLALRKEMITMGFTMQGDELKRIREGMGLTQAELAKKLGVDPATVWRWENGGVKRSGSRIPKAIEVAIRLLKDAA